MAKTFGNTWWGEQWLNSLTHLDYENRIPRGASYARKGAVVDVKINGNIVSAKVAGSRRTPYRVTLIIPPFFADQVDQLIDAIMARPALISKLLNRELDPQILTIAQRLGLKVFPSQWTDFKMQCNCPDWAVPCKHLAAVIYMLSQEIDNNPFRVFEMHCVDLIGELNKRGIVIKSSNNMGIPMFDSLLIPRKKVQTDLPIFQRIDFSGLSDITEPLINLLPDNPVFDNRGNFKEKYSGIVQKTVRNAQRVFSKNLSPEGLFLNIKEPLPLPKRAEACVEIDDMMGAVIDLHWDIAANDKKLPTYTIEQFAWALHSIHPDFLSDYQPSIAALHQAYFAALNLLTKGAVVPRIVKLADKQFAVCWQPAFIDPQIRKIFTQLEAIFPGNTVMARLKKRKKHIPLDNQASSVVSLFLNLLIKNLAGNRSNDYLSDLFFASSPYAFVSPGELEQPGGIQTWLDRFFLGKGGFRPVFTVDEEDGQFFLNIAIEQTNDEYVEPIALNRIFTDSTFLKDRFGILQEITLLTPFVDGLNEYINNNAVHPIQLDLSTLAPFLMKSVPAIRLLDVKVILPKCLQSLIRPKATLKIDRKDQVADGYIRLDDLLTFDFRVAIGNEILSVEDFQKLIKHASGLIKFKESYIYVDEKDIQHIRKALSSPPRLSKAQLLQAALTKEHDATPVEISSQVDALIKELTSDENIALPQKIMAKLRPYQERGFSWMYRNMRIGFGSIIADDMGLGKTLQVITLLLKIKEEGALNKQKALIVAPTGLLTNWEAEFARFAPSLSVHTYHGTSRNLKNFDEDVLLTSYGMIRSDASVLKKRKWEIMVIDEAQNIKNHSTEQSKAVKSISAGVHVAMSGTPVENRLTEFWSIMDYANKGYLDTVNQFVTDFAKPIQLTNDMDCVNRFRKITAPFMMRRLKSDRSIISDLPDKIELNRFSQLTAPQAALYDQTLETAMTTIEAIVDTDRESLFTRQGLVLQLILALKQICNHPTQFLKNGDLRPELSGKVDLLMELLQTIIESDEKVLIFTQFREMGEMLQSFIEQQFGERPMFYHGGCSIEQRKEMVERFQKNKADKVFILSLKAAGTGLNLTAASHVIHYDLWWNPAVEAQATDRAYRIGQNKNVMVYRFITKNTFEERIDQMIQDKKKLADLTVASGESWIGKLSNKELREIFG